jgi:precorrin-2 dehydrogenase / sirohydrochlorin ferrochelatase
MSNTLFPIFLKLEQMHILIVGGGNVGLEKLEAVLKNSPKATISLVAPLIKKEIEELAKNHNITLLNRAYHQDDLFNKDLVIAGTDSPEVNAQVRKDGRALKLLVNVADTPELCDFYLSSVVKKGDLKIAISTNGKSPTFAKRFREILEDVLPESLQETLDNLKILRDKLKGDFSYKVDKLNEITNVMKKEN